MAQKQIAIFASGSGSNAENLINYFRQSKMADVGLILSNKISAYVLMRAKNLSIPSIVVSNSNLKNQPESILDVLAQFNIDYIVLAGFLRKIPKELIKAYPNKIINIHPALLPKFGGKGMYGANVHKAVKQANQTQSGISIHLVNQAYDEGQIIFQAKTNLTTTDTAKTIEKKVRALEIKHFPIQVENYIKQHNNLT